MQRAAKSSGFASYQQKSSETTNHVIPILPHKRTPQMRQEMSYKNTKGETRLSEIAVWIELLLHVVVGAACNESPHPPVARS